MGADPLCPALGRFTANRSFRASPDNVWPLPVLGCPTPRFPPYNVRTLHVHGAPAIGRSRHGSEYVAACALQIPPARRCHTTDELATWHARLLRCQWHHPIARADPLPVVPPAGDTTDELATGWLHHVDLRSLVSMQNLPTRTKHGIVEIP